MYKIHEFSIVLVGDKSQEKARKSFSRRYCRFQSLQHRKSLIYHILNSVIRPKKNNNRLELFKDKSFKESINKLLLKKAFAI